MKGLLHHIQPTSGAAYSQRRATIIDPIGALFPMALSLAICPAVDGAGGGPHVFDSDEDVIGPSAPVRAMTLESSEVLEDGVVWLRYRLQNG
jgi:hypothetical protein